MKFSAPTGEHKRNKTGKLENEFHKRISKLLPKKKKEFPNKLTDRPKSILAITPVSMKDFLAMQNNAALRKSKP